MNTYKRFIANTLLHLTTPVLVISVVLLNNTKLAAISLTFLQMFGIIFFSVLLLKGKSVIYALPLGSIATIVFVTVPLLTTRL